MKRRLTVDWPVPGTNSRVPASNDVEYDSGDEATPLNVNALRWVLVLMIAFWLAVFCVGRYLIW